MIPLEEARKIIEETIGRTSETEQAGLYDITGRVLAEEIRSDVDIPPFNRATMDGYAIVSSDGPGEYMVVEDIPAGKFPQCRVEAGQVSKIMTGAPLPDGADAVIQVEKTGGFADVGEMASINASVKAGVNFSLKGEDVKVGDLALRPGAYIRPAEVAVLASMGYDTARVYKRPAAAILATGDELVPAGEMPRPGQIRNTNEYSTYSQLKIDGDNPHIPGDCEG